MIARQILLLNKEKISDLALIKNAGLKKIDDALEEIDRVVMLLEMLNCDDYELLEALSILKGSKCQ